MTDTFSQNYVKTFRASCHGVGLKWRGPSDPHVIVTLLVEDDDNWFDQTKNETFLFSCCFIPGLVSVLKEAEDWIVKNCEPDIYNGIQFGYKFKTGDNKCPK